MMPQNSSLRKLNAEELIRELGGTPRPNGTNVLCPAHDDKNPSLTIGENSDGKVLVNCHAGCPQETVINTLRNEYGIILGESDPNNHLSEFQPETSLDKLRNGLAIGTDAKGKDRSQLRQYLASRGIRKLPVNLYAQPPQPRSSNYLEKLDRFIAPMSATNKEDFWDKFRGVQVRYFGQPYGQDKWEGYDIRTYGNVKGSVFPIGEDEPFQLCVAEGVETALSIWQATGIKTWAVFGATNMDNIVLPEICQEVIVCADNDQAGMNAAERLAERASRSGRTARLAVPPYEGWDWNDMLVAGELSANDIVNADILEASAQVPGQTMKNFIAQDLPPRMPIMDPILARAEVGMIFAKRGVGKTFFTLGIAVALATGKPFLKWKSREAVRVLYVDGEMTATNMQKRLNALRRYNNISSDSRDLDNFILINNQDLHEEQDMPKINTESGQATLKEWTDYYAPDVIVIDNLSCMISGEENDNATWQPIKDWIIRQRRNNRAVLLVHHAGKSGAERGWGGKEDQIELSLALEHPSNYNPEDGARFVVNFSKARELDGVDQKQFEVTMQYDGTDMEWHWEHPGDSREEQVATMLNKGHTQQEIANQLSLNKGTVSKYAKRARDKNLA